WRMVDLSEANGERIDLVVATKFPTYFVRHPHKVTWLFHQYRAIYDLFSNARNTAARLAHYNGVAAEPLYHPPPLAGKLKDGASGDYFLSVGRLETVKRVDLIIAALARVPAPSRLVIVGDGPLRAQLEEKASAA